MSSTQPTRIATNKLKTNPNNPRTIRKDQLEKLVKSLREFPEMLEARPIVVDPDYVVLGGNMRLKAAQEAGLAEVPVYVATWEEAKHKEFVIKDNLAFGEWDWDMLANEWDAEELDDWGLELPIETETERLSKLEYTDIYYEPKNQPKLKLADCLNMDKFNAKLKVIEESPLENQQKQLMQWFAYRFVKIDFESVANYYFFNASEDEQKVMERLRLVLCDSGVQGFIDDDLLRIHEMLSEFSND